MVPLWYRLGARIRGPATLGGLAGVVVGLLVAVVAPDGWPAVPVILVLTIGGLFLLVVGVALNFLPLAPRLAARPVGSPVGGRWVVVNSPTSRVPSHGTHAHGQTFAVDLVFEPSPGDRPAFGAGRAFRPPQDFPGFGVPVRAPADGRVIAMRDTARDHRSRSTWPAFGYLMLEAMVRELAGSGGLLGNVIVLDIGQGCYAVLAHLQRGSVTVRRGDRVRRGDVVARCGNSGNSTEPHLHFQLMDHGNPFIAAGLPFTFADIQDGLPGNEQAIVAPSTVAEN